MQFSHLKSIYRNYDIRGQFPNEITTDEVYKIGKALVDLYGPKKIVVGYDNRPSTAELYDALVRGITEQGADVW
jgi:phosphomannomutase